MKFFTAIFICLYFLTASAFAQSKTEQTLSKYQTFYAAEEESIYTQLNKDIFFEGEKLWFKSYIYGVKAQKPFLATANVKAIIYNSEGTPVTHKMFYAQQGTTTGNFSIDSTLQPGIYFLKTTTTYMQNFSNDLSAINCFQVKGNQIKNELQTTKKETIILTPEGGNLVANTTNTVAFKIQDKDGYGLKTNKIKLVNTKGEQIAICTNNQFGIGKFLFIPKEEENYTLEAVLPDGTITKKTLPKASNQGIHLAITTNYKDQFYISLHTNKNTLPSLIKNPYTLLIHKEGNLKKVAVPFEKNTLDYNFPIKKSELYPGINIITLLNTNGIPVAERLIYNDSNSKVKNLQLQEVKKQHDSIQIVLHTTTPDSTYVNLSATVLPEYSASYNQNQSLLYKFILDPYLKTPVENPEYYFKDSNRKTIYDLDLLLISEGKSTYNWEAIANDTQEKSFPFEVGFTIEGHIDLKKLDKEDQLYLISKKSGLFQEIEIKKDLSFLMKKVFIRDSSDINFTLINKRGNNKKPKVNYTITPEFQSPAKLDPKTLAVYYKPEKAPVLFDTNSPFIAPEAIALSSVEVVGKKKEVTVEHHPLVPRNAKNIELPKNSPSMSVLDLIRANGFQAQTSIDGTTTIKTPFPTSINASQSPLILINDMPIQDFSPYNHLTVNDIDGLYISKFNSLYGMRGSNGTIHIYTKTGIDSALNSGREILASQISETGFSDQEIYYEPQYNKSDVKQFQNFGVINWIPYVSAPKKDIYTITFPKYQYPVKIYIEGMDTEGNLYNEIITIDPAKDL